MTCRVQSLAERDLAAILDELEEKAGAATALKYAVAFDLCLQRISQIPAAGAPRPRLGVNARLVIVSPYLVIYDYDAEAGVSTVLRVLHSRRNITKRLLAR